MFLPPRYGGISRLYSFTIRFNDGPCQSPNYPRLARTAQDQGDSIIPRIHQLLPSVYTCLLEYHYSSYPAHPQRHQVGFLRKAFNDLKMAFLSGPLLTHWIPDTPIIIEMDASDYAIAAILSIALPDGEIHPVAFHSHTLTSPQLNYDTHDKELLAIFKAFQKWRHYLEGSG